MSIEEFIIQVFGCIAEEYDLIVKPPLPLRKRGYNPQLSESEARTMEIVGEFVSIDTDKGIWRYFRNHWHNWFPNLGSRANFVKQSSHRFRIKQLIWQRVAHKLGAFSDPIHIVDGFPMPVCQLARAKPSTCFRGEAQEGHCATNKPTYYGCRGQVVISFNGIITDFTVVPANVEERDSLPEITYKVKWLLLGDQG